MKTASLGFDGSREVAKERLKLNMERNENGLYSLLNRNGAAGGGSNGAPGGGNATNTENGGMGGCRCEGCGNRQLAMVYSPMQCWRRLYTPDDALVSGTLFEELYKPYEEVW